MRILYLSQYFFPEQFLNNHLAKALVERGHAVDVVCCVPNYPSGRFFEGYSNLTRRREEWSGVDIHRVSTIPRGKRKLQLLLNYLWYPIAASWRILFLAKPFDISFVSMPSPLLQGIAGIFARVVRRVPTVFWVQDIWPDSAIVTLNLRNRMVVWLLRALCGWIYRQADLVLVQSDGFHQRIKAFGVDESKIFTLPNTAPGTFTSIEPDDVPKPIRDMIPQDRRIIMFAGNIGVSQDFETIIAAAELLPADCDLLIVIVGSGREEERVRQKVRESGLDHRFLFLGRHPEYLMPAFLACAHAALVSLRDEPIFALTVPSKVQSYLACGKPIVASIAGEGAAIVRASGAGVAVEPSNPTALAGAFRAVADMPASQLDTMAENARRAYLADYSLDAVTGKLINFLAAAAKPKRIGG